MVKRGLKNGWCIEQWSWRNSLNATYRELATRNPDRMRLFFLDDFQDQLN